MKTIYAPHRSKWRAWLEKNARTTEEIWLIFYKKGSNRPCVTYNDAVEEALCFGWIDGRVRSLDATRYMQRFTRRKARSAWATSNIERVQRMIAQNKMTADGLAAFQGHEKRKVRVLPTKLGRTLEQRFRSATKAWRNFQSFPPGYRRMAIGWVASAKKEETQARRLATLVQFSARNERLGFI